MRTIVLMAVFCLVGCEQGRLVTADIQKAVAKVELCDRELREVRRDLEKWRNTQYQWGEVENLEQLISILQEKESKLVSDYEAAKQRLAELTE